MHDLEQHTGDHLALSHSRASMANSITTSPKPYYESATSLAVESGKLQQREAAFADPAS